MTVFIKGLILIIFALVIFGQSLFPSKTLYWAMYFVMFSLIPLLWRAMFWVSEKRALKVCPGKYDYDTFVGKVSQNVQDDLSRGRLLVNSDCVKLVGKQNGRYALIWECNTNDIQSVGFGTVAGVRKGFTLHLKDCEVSFTSSKISKEREKLYKALGWK